MSSASRTTTTPLPAPAPNSSRVIGRVDGAPLLSNPALPIGNPKGFTWREPTGTTLFGRNPVVSMEHVDQGMLGNCWSMAAMGAIAQRTPEVISRLVREVGDDVVVDFPSGPVAVTKELPFTAKGRPAFGAHNGGKVLWAAYVEKAQAALKPAGYPGMAGGIAGNAFAQLLGTAPVVHTDSTSNAFDDAVAGARARLPTVLGSTGRVRQGDGTPLGMLMGSANVFAGHAYIVRSAVKTATGEPAITLFNPWGKNHPTRPLTRDEVNRIFVNSSTPKAVEFYERQRRSVAGGEVPLPLDAGPHLG